MSAPTVQFKCIKCGDQPESLEALRRHITVEHLRWIPFECLFCEVFKATEMQLREHVQAKHPGKPFRLVLVSDPTNQQRLQQLIDQSTRPAIDNSQSASITRSPAAIETGAVAKRNSPNGSYLTASPAGLQQKPRSHHGIIDTAIPRVKAEIRDASAVTLSLQTSISSPPEKVAPLPAQRGSKRQWPVETGVLRSEAKRACRKRNQNSKVQSKFNYAGMDTSYCRLCRAKRSHASPIEHIYYRHIGENAIVCKFCSFTTRYNTNDMTKHLQKNHQSMAVGVGYEDRRKEFEPRVQELIRRCFGKEAYEESDLESSGTTTQAVESPASERCVTATRMGSTITDDAQNAESGSPQAAADQTEQPSEGQADGTVEALMPEQSTEADAVATDDNDNPEAVSPKPKTGLMTGTAGACTECGKEVNSKHRREHIFVNHLKANAIHCNYCDYSVKRRDLMQSHLSKYHASKDQTSGFDDRRGQFEEQYNELKTRCFPNAETAAPITKASGVKQQTDAQKQTKAVFCHLCQKAVRERKQPHADRKHMQLPLLSCNFCDYTRPNNVTQMKIHLAKCHPNESLTGFVDRRVELATERQIVWQQCFGGQLAAEPEATTDNTDNG